MPNGHGFRALLYTVLSRSPLLSSNTFFGPTLAEILHKIETFPDHRFLSHAISSLVRSLVNSRNISRRTSSFLTYVRLC